MIHQGNAQRDEATHRPAAGKRWTRLEKAVPGSIRQALIERSRAT